eukprot:12911362-Prorocentrum_lima.AAC.1
MLRVASEYRSFSRRQGEPIEEAIARFDLPHTLATTMNVQEINATNLGLKLTQAFRVPASLYPSVLSHTYRRIPNTAHQIEKMKTSLKRWSHLLEASLWSIHSSVQDSRFRPSQGVNF